MLDELAENENEKIEDKDQISEEEEDRRSAKNRKINPNDI